MLDGLGRDFRFCGELGQDQAQAKTDEVDEEQGTRVRWEVKWQCIRTSTPYEGSTTDDFLGKRIAKVKEKLGR